MGILVNDRLLWLILARTTRVKLVEEMLFSILSLVHCLLEGGAMRYHITNVTTA